MDEIAKVVLTFLLPTLVGALLGSIPGIMTARNQRNNSFADNAEKITNSALVLVEPLREDITKLRETNNNLTSKIEGLSKKIQNLESELRDAILETALLSEKLEIWIHGAGMLYSQLVLENKIPMWELPFIKKTE